MSIRSQLYAIKQYLKGIFFGDLFAKGARADIILHGKPPNFDKFDITQKLHYRRYEYARSVIKDGGTVADLACGTGYGSIMLAEKAERVIGVDVSEKVISRIQQRYTNNKSVEFICDDLLNLKYETCFDAIVSFETIEHFEPEQIPVLLALYYKALKNQGQLLLSTPYRQIRTPQLIKKGFHKTFDIDEDKINRWLEQTGFRISTICYQNSDTFEIEVNPTKKEFIICLALVSK